MAIKFGLNSYTVEVETAGNPVENWLNAQSDMIDLLQCESPEMQQNRFYYLELLRSLQPDLETAKKMLTAKD